MSKAKSVVASTTYASPNIKQQSQEANEENKEFDSSGEDNDLVEIKHTGPIAQGSASGNFKGSANVSVNNKGAGNGIHNQTAMTR